MAVIRLKEGDKRKVTGKKKGLKGERVWIEDDLTWMERRWKFREVVVEKERKGARIWIGSSKVMIEWE